MTEILDVVKTTKEKMAVKGKAGKPTPEELETARQIVAEAKAAGVSMAGHGVLKALTQMVIQTALDEEMVSHLGYEKHDVMGRNRGNSRNGSRSKTVLTDTVGEVDLQVPRDRDGTFEPVIVRKHQRRLNQVDEMVLSLTAHGMTTGEIKAHFEEIYGVQVSKDTISRITEKVTEEMHAWVSRPLECVYAAIFIDALVIKVRDGQVANRPFYAAIGVDLEGNKDVLGFWAGNGDGESAKFWFSVLTELKNRGVSDVLFLICDGLKGLPASVADVWPATTVQTCVVHLIRNSFKYVPRQKWDALKRDLKPIYQAANEQAARKALDELADKWGTKYAAMIRVWENAWEEFIPFLDYHVEIRKVIYTTNAIESLNARYRRAVKARGHFPTEQAALKCLYLVTRSLDPKGTGQAKWAMRWKPALNAFAITFADRIPGLNRD